MRASHHAGAANELRILDCYKDFLIVEGNKEHRMSPIKVRSMLALYEV